jgi:hypothetical protein
MNKLIPPPGKSRFTLTPGEQQTPLYIKLRKHWETRLQELREKNDSAALTPEETARLRGRIDEIKLLLKAGVETAE